MEQRKNKDLHASASDWDNSDEEYGSSTLPHETWPQFLIVKSADKDNPFSSLSPFVPKRAVEGMVKNCKIL